MAVGEASHADRYETRKQPTTQVTTLPATRTPEGNESPTKSARAETRLCQRSLSSLVTGHGLYGHGLYAQIGHASHVLSVKPGSRTLSKEYK